MPTLEKTTATYNWCR